MPNEFWIVTDADGTEHIRDPFPTAECRFCGAKINIIVAGFNPAGACNKCVQKNPQIWFTKEMDIIPLNKVPNNGSPFGNNFYGITKSQIDELLNGGVLYSLGEYGTFIKLVEE